MTDTPPPPPPAPLTPDPALMMTTRKGIPVAPRSSEGPTVPHVMVGMVVAIVALALLFGIVAGYLAGTTAEPNRKVDGLTTALCAVLHEVAPESARTPAIRTLCP